MNTIVDANRIVTELFASISKLKFDQTDNLIEYAVQRIDVQ